MRPIIINSKRLALKAVHPDDLEAIALLRADPDVMRYVGDGQVWSQSQVEHWLEKSRGYFERYQLDFFSVFEKSSGLFIGQAGLFHLGFDTTQNQIELAYRFHKQYWGKGYATEVSRALIDYGFNHLCLDKIVAMHYPDNKASQHVLKKCGFRYTKDIDYKNKPIPFYTLNKRMKKSKNVP